MTHRRHLPLADAPMRSKRVLRAFIQEGLERFNALSEVVLQKFISI
jgi:hypothetical protein